MFPKFIRLAFSAHCSFIYDSVNFILASILSQIRTQAPLPLFRRLWHLYICCFFTRLIIIFITLKRGSTTYLFEYDLVLKGILITSPMMKNNEGILSASFVEFFILYVDRSLFATPDAYLWSLLADWTVENPRHFFTLNPRVPEPKFNFFKPISSYRSIRGFFRQINAVPELKFNSPQLPVYRPEVSPIIRAKTIFLSRLLQFILAFLLQALELLACLATFGGCLGILTQDKPNGFLCIFYFVDAALVNFRFFYILRLVLFLLYSKILTAFVECAHLKQVNAQLEGESRKVHSSSFWNTFTTFNGQHNAVGYDCLQANERLISPLLFIAMLTNLAINVYSVSLVFLMKYEAKKKLFDILVAVAQFAFFFFAIQPMLRLSELYHAPARTLMRCPLSQRKGQRSECLPFLKNKLKLMTVCELVHTDRGLYFTMGPWGAVSYANTCKFLMKYLSYFLLLASMLKH